MLRASCRLCTGQGHKKNWPSHIFVAWCLLPLLYLRGHDLNLKWRRPSVSSVLPIHYIGQILRRIYRRQLFPYVAGLNIRVTEGSWNRYMVYWGRSSMQYSIHCYSLMKKWFHFHLSNDRSKVTISSTNLNICSMLTPCWSGQRSHRAFACPSVIQSSSPCPLSVPKKQAKIGPRFVTRLLYTLCWIEHEPSNFPPAFQQCQKKLELSE